ncbi:Hypothetical Protein FCC1311_054022 [Hondaea fermentalgiana]|uniref:EF-hand domain-containing protein n=1 Tax=Hondaea fermentalgiana TaxID=2315210 RepID=A0A2R5GE14_9STRA|nr:Hypothetical Protein FCC1311_054022 [Hondaea fermentalgiana]|eukprot:GBG29180.1 Hypothetical Protein FCC1311_054022 [Hondaea fermentalgiana]
MREAKRHQVIVSNIKRLEELEGDERDKLNTQLKVLDRLSPRCKGANDAANKMLSLFRKCLPDEFGFVRKRNFLHEMRRSYGLDHPEAERLFRIASDNGDEITYKQFRNAFSRIDKSTTFIPESYRPILKRDPDEQAHREAPPSPQPVAPKSFQSMTHAEREAHRQRTRILNALESSHVKMQARFRRAEEEPGGANIRVRTKLTYPEVAQILNEFGVEVSADALANLYGAKDSSESQELTFSQLHRRTADYFAQLEAGDAAVGDDHRNMELKGQYLGCRRMLKPLEDAEKARKKSGAVSEAAASNQHADHTSDAAIPKNDGQENDKEGARRRRRRRRRRRHSALPTVSETMAQIRNPTREEDNIWKAHWTDKTIPKTDRTPGIRITDTGRRMQQGNGDILRWETDSLEPHPLETYRELDTGRSTLSSASFYSDFY